MIKKTPIISVFNYNNEKLTDIYTNDVKATYEYGVVSSLSFKIPYYHYDANERLLFQNNGEKGINPKITHLKNENIVKFDDEVFIIKNTRKVRDDALYFLVECIGFAVQLSYKNISYLSTKPPETNPLKISSNILYALTARNKKGKGIVSNYTNDTITLNGDFPTGTDKLKGYYIAVIDGVGQGYNYEINSSVDNQVTINGNLVEQLEVSKTLCMVHDSNYTVGYIDESFFIDEDLEPIYRSFEFDGETVMSAINKIAKRMEGYLTYNAYYDDFYGGFVCEIGLKTQKETYENVEFRYGKNLNGIEKELDTKSNIYTVLYPYGDDISIHDIPDITREDNGIIYLEHEEGKPYIQNYQYFLNQGYSLEFCKKNFYNDKEVNDDLYVNPADLYKDYAKKLNELSQPKMTYNIKGTDLSFFNGYDYTKFNTGDKIRIYDSELGVSIFANVIKKTIDYTKPYEANIEISNIVDNFSNYIVERLNGIKEYTNNKTNENSNNFQKSNYNLLNNGGCELSLNKQNEIRFWDLDNVNISTTPVEDEALSGSKSFSLNDTTGTSGAGELSQIVNNIIPNKPYTASCSLLTDNCDAELIVEEINGSGGIVATHVKTYKPLFFVEQDLILNFTSDVDCDRVRYIIKKYQSEDTNPSKVIFDNCKLENGTKKTPYIEIASDLEYYDNNMVYYGVEMNEAVGLLIEREDKLARAQFNADKFVMQTGDGNGNYTDALRFDPNSQKYIFTGTLQATDIIGGTIEINSPSAGFRVDSNGKLFSTGAEISGEFETIGTTGNISSRIYQEGSIGGKLELFTNTGELNAVIGDANLIGDNIGGTIILYNRDSSKQRVELGIDASSDGGAVNFRNTFGYASALLYGASNVGDDGQFVLHDSTGQTTTDRGVSLRGGLDKLNYIIGKVAIGSRSVGSSNQMQVDGRMYADTLASNTLQVDNYEVLDGFSYTSGDSGSFESADGKTVTVINGIVTNIL